MHEVLLAQGKVSLGQLTMTIVVDLGRKTTNQTKQDLGGLSCGPGVCVSWSASGLGVRLAPLGRFRPSGGVFY